MLRQEAHTTRTANLHSLQELGSNPCIVDDTMYHKDHTGPFHHTQANDKYNEFVLPIVFQLYALYATPNVLDKK